MSEKHPLRSQAAGWFNAAWKLIDKPDRSEIETLDMLAKAQASFAAWMEVPDHNATHISIGAWQVSRVHALAGEGHLAEAWARRSLEAASDASVDPFFRAYAREALARARRVQGRPAEVVAEVALAREALKGTGEDELEALHADLAELEASPGSSRFFQVSVHHPKPEFVGHVIDSMHRFGAAARTQKGLVEVRTLRSQDRKTLVGYAVWESAEAKAAANPALRAAVGHDDFDAWEDVPLKGWGLESI